MPEKLLGINCSPPAMFPSRPASSATSSNTTCRHPPLPHETIASPTCNGLHLVVHRLNGHLHNLQSMPILQKTPYSYSPTCNGLHLVTHRLLSRLHGRLCNAVCLRVRLLRRSQLGLDGRHLRSSAAGSAGRGSSEGRGHWDGPQSLRCSTLLFLTNCTCKSCCPPAPRKPPAESAPHLLLHLADARLCQLQFLALLQQLVLQRNSLLRLLGSSSRLGRGRGGGARRRLLLSRCTSRLLGCSEDESDGAEDVNDAKT